MRRAIIMDRDGTICEESGYVGTPDRVRLLDGVAEAVRRANEAGFQTVVVTNQSGVARGYFSEEAVGEVHDRIREMLAEHGARMDGFYHCPHHPDVGPAKYRSRCECRKPEPGLLHKARDEMGIDLPSSYVIGDSIRDVEAGHRVGATTILVLTGYGRRELDGPSGDTHPRPDHVAADLREAVGWILARESNAREAVSRNAERP